MKIEKTCACGKNFFVRPHKRETAKFCSKECKYKFYVKSTGFKRVEERPNPSWFASGKRPWNAGTVGMTKANAGSFQKGDHRSVTTEFRKGHVPSVPPESLPRGDAHPLWKGDAVGYNALHDWVRRHRGKPTQCEHCGADDRIIHWANKSHEYKRDLNDWLALCVPCHKAYDMEARCAA